MAARRPVLGNDPFRSGAARRDGGPTAPPVPQRRKPAATGRTEPGLGSATSGETSPPVPPPERAAPPPAPASRETPPARVSVPATAPVPPGAALSGAIAAIRKLAGLSGAPPSLEVDELGRDAELTREVWPLLEWIHDRWFRVEARGLELLPEGPAILVANRAGLVPWDSLMLSVTARRHGRELRPLVEDPLFHFPALGVLINRLGAVRASPENAERVLAGGASVAVFPEGAQGLAKGWRDRYRLQRFGRGGFVKLALRTGTPIVPVAIVGSEEASPVLARLPGVLGLPRLPLTPTFPWLGLAGLLPLPSRWIVEVGAPVDLGGRGARDAADDPAVMRLTETTRSTIQAMLDRLIVAS